MSETVSVAMAAYNGEKYLSQQLDSIISELRDNDELIVSLDPSSDGSREILEKYSANDKRVTVVDGPGKGLIKNFENAIKSCKKDIIFLSDQDDVWLKGKLTKVLSCFADINVQAVLHDAKLCDGDMNVTAPSFFSVHGSKGGAVNNLIKNSYMGCCMAFRRTLVPEVIPFPEKLPMHDQWIGIIAELNGKTLLLNEPLLLYRRHGGNVSSTEHSSIINMFGWRISVAISVLKYSLKRKR